MNRKTNLTAPNGSDFRGAQAATARQPRDITLDLFAEELPVQHDLLPYSTVGSYGTASTVGSVGGCVGTAGTLSTVGSLS